jgi:hypothetical protein
VSNGALYVGEYTGNESKGHTARIWRVVPGAAPVLFASGLTTISALASGPDGALYVSDWSVAGATRKDAYRKHTGRILRVT